MDTFALPLFALLNRALAFSLSEILIFNESSFSVSGHYPTLLTRQQLAPWISYPVQWRTQGIGGEVLFPQAWGKFMHA